MRKYVIIVAGGTGNRMNSALPKQFMLLKGKPVMYYAIHSFLETYYDAHIILVLPEEHVTAGQEIIDAFFGYDRIKIVIGGRTRFHSVQQGLAEVQDEESVIFVHDAVRPFVSRALIERCFEGVLETGSAVPVIDCIDSVRLLTPDGNEAIERNTVRLVQTPQAFLGKILLAAFCIDYKDKFTDEATVVEAYGIKVSLVQGDEGNIKITRVADLEIAEQYLK